MNKHRTFPHQKNHIKVTSKLPRLLGLGRGWGTKCSQNAHCHKGGSAPCQDFFGGFGKVFQAMLPAPHHTWYIVHGTHGTHGTLICQIYAIFSPLRAFMGQHRQNIMIRGSNQLWQCQHFGNIWSSSFYREEDDDGGGGGINPSQVPQPTCFWKQVGCKSGGDPV